MIITGVLAKSSTSTCSKAMVAVISLLASPIRLPIQVQTFPITTIPPPSRHGWGAAVLQGGRRQLGGGGGALLNEEEIKAVSYSSKALFVSNHRRSLLTKSTLWLSQQRGLEVRTTGGATPSEGGMTLYLKAGPDGTSVGDCPFAHLVRMVLEEKGLEYELRPCGSNEAKPAWLIEHYGGSMPALRHRQECYIESDVIAQYLDFFFQDPPLSLPKKKLMKEAERVTEEIFPAIAKYLKYSSTNNNDDDEEELKLKDLLVGKLTDLEKHLSNESRTGPYLVGDGEQFTLLDCSLAPKLYHLKVGIDAFKKGRTKIDIPVDFPNVKKYMDAVFARPSFLKTVYPEETVIWGWENARNKQ